MLVLTRKEGEQILIGEDITVRIVLIDKGKVRIGIEAPRDVKILRAELEGTDYEPPTKGVSHAEAEVKSGQQPQEDQQAEAK